MRGNGAGSQPEDALRRECPTYRRCGEGSHVVAREHFSGEAHGGGEPNPRVPRYVWGIVITTLAGALAVIVGAIAVTAH